MFGLVGGRSCSNVEADKYVGGEASPSEEVWARDVTLIKCPSWSKVKARVEF